MEHQLLEQLAQTEGYLYHQETFGTVDGPGIRYVVFLQGCPLRCLYCHNPDSRAPQKGEKNTAGAVVEEIIRYRPFLRSGGVTLSGGEPLYQPEFSLALLTLLKNAGFHTALDVSGCESPQSPLVQQSLQTADLILLDIKALDDNICQQLTGRSNKYALQTLEYCQSIGKPVWIRHVLLPDYTLDPVLLEKLALFLKPYNCVEKVELLPFHKMGEVKWEQLGIPYLLKDTPAVSQEEAELARDIFRQHSLPVQ